MARRVDLDSAADIPHALREWLDILLVILLTVPPPSPLTLRGLGCSTYELDQLLKREQHKSCEIGSDLCHDCRYKLHAYVSNGVLYEQPAASYIPCITHRHQHISDAARVPVFRIEAHPRFKKHIKQQAYSPTEALILCSHHHLIFHESRKQRQLSLRLQMTRPRRRFIEGSHARNWAQKA